MNIWALDKDVNIKHLLLMLEEVFGRGGIAIFSHEDDDQRAIRLTHPEDQAISIYVFTYGQHEGRYGVHVEYPNLEEASLSDTLDIYDNLDFDLLVALLSNHLGLSYESLQQERCWRLR